MHPTKVTATCQKRHFCVPTSLDNDVILNVYHRLNRLKKYEKTVELAFSVLQPVLPKKIVDSLLRGSLFSRIQYLSLEVDFCRAIINSSTDKALS